MPTALAVVAALRGGALITPRAPDADPDDVMVNDERTVMVIDNTAGLNTVTVKAVTQVTVDSELSLAVADPTFTVATLTTLVCGPYPDVDYNEQAGADEGKMHFQLTGGDGNERIFAISIPPV